TINLPSAAIGPWYSPSANFQTCRPVVGSYAYVWPGACFAPMSAAYTSEPITTAELSERYGSLCVQRRLPVRASIAANVPSYDVANTLPKPVPGEPYAQSGIVDVHAICPVDATNEYTLPSVLPT